MIEGENVIPIAIALRKHFAESYYRDTFVRALNSPEIDSAFIASGFFSDFTGRLDGSAPDFGIGEQMEGKEVFLFGGYEEEASSMRALKDALTRRGLKAYASQLAPPGPGAPKLRWHAKVAVFLSGTRPVLAIVGSSNLTNPSMYGSSELRFTASPEPIHVEADSFYWLRGHMDADQAMHDVFHYWGGGRLAPKITFGHEKFDTEIEKLIESVYSDLLTYPWRDL
ncbi:phospholipase D family protein [Ralstonia solanacearum]|uniref:phospholipase D family protein n=1 Tax=Ralstonia solanacearum TaxID=305 RepID=UPI0018D18CA4|nr:phospholipase D family protein [Ralstonia solanacearum]